MAGETLTPGVVGEKGLVSVTRLAHVGGEEMLRLPHQGDKMGQLGSRWPHSSQ